MEVSNNTGNIKCSSSEELVAYLYEEMNAHQKASVEEHLVDCDACTSEFADLSFARLDVYEWHRDEFTEMATPRIAIPYGEAAAVSWFDGVRAFFASPARFATAGAGFALAAISFGLWMFTASGPEMAKNDASPTPEVQRKVPTVTQPLTPRIENGRDEVTSAPAPLPAKKAWVKASATIEPKNSVRTRRALTTNAQPVRTTAPRLNDFEDEDDTTLRLGDLLAEVDTRD